MVELHEAIQNLQDHKWLGKMVDQRTLRHTIRSFLNMFLTRELATQFSWTVIGSKSTSTKVSFRDHELRVVLDRSSTPHRSQEEQIVLKTKRGRKVSLRGFRLEC